MMEELWGQEPAQGCSQSSVTADKKSAAPISLPEVTAMVLQPVPKVCWDENHELGAKSSHGKLLPRFPHPEMGLPLVPTP